LNWTAKWWKYEASVALNTKHSVSL